MTGNENSPAVETDQNVSAEEHTPAVEDNLTGSQDTPAVTADAGVSAKSTPPAVKARRVSDALPYIRRFSADRPSSSTAGAPSGGDDGTLSRSAKDVVLLRSVGICPVVVHGGGPQIGVLMRRLGKVPEFRDGLRVTDSETSTSPEWSSSERSTGTSSGRSMPTGRCPWACRARTPD